MECKKCVNRQRSGYCPKLGKYVPKKQTWEGINPAKTCGKFMKFRTKKS